MRISQPLLRTCYYTAFRLKYNKFLCRVQYYTIRVQDEKRDHRTAVITATPHRRRRAARNVLLY